MAADYLNNHVSRLPAGTEVVSVQSSNSPAFLRKVFECYEARTLLAISRADTDLELLGLRVSQVDVASEPASGWFDLQQSPIWSDDPAQIVFTSGTEGRPKPIVLSHRNLADVVERLNGAMAVCGEIREYIGIPVTYSFGLGRARAIAAVGGRSYIPERFDPLEIARLLSNGEINAVSAVPSLWRVVLSNPDALNGQGGKVRWIEIGSQHLTPDEKIAIRELFPNARIVQHYGLSEASRSTFLNISGAEAPRLASVGRASGNVEIAISGEGAIKVRGPHVALGTLAPDGIIDPLVNSEGWLETKDRGELQGEYLHFLGRMGDQINLAGKKLSAEVLERRVEKLCPEARSGFVLTSIPDDLRGERVALAVDENSAHLAPLLEAATKLALEHHGVIGGGGLVTHLIDTIPRTGTGKVQRNLVAATVSKSVSEREPAILATDNERSGIDFSDDEQKVVTAWRSVLGDVPLTPESSFYDIGGDSLSSLQVALQMERSGLSPFAVRAMFEGRSLAKVAALADNERGKDSQSQIDPAQVSSDTVRNWSVSVARGLMVISVLVSHWGPGVVERLGLAEFLQPILAPIYRMGTPGFATVFGIGVGLFMLPAARLGNTSVRKRARFAVVVISIGLALQVLLSVALAIAQSEAVSTRWIIIQVFNVLTFYLLAYGTAPLWLPRIAKYQHPGLLCLACVPLLWSGYLVLDAFWVSEPESGVLALVRLFSVAHYSIFRMGAIAILGVAIGYWLSTQSDNRLAGRRLFSAGFWAASISIVSVIDFSGPSSLSDRGSEAFGSLMGYLLFASISVAMVGSTLLLLESWSRRSKAVQSVLKFLIVLGALALPIYVFHSLVIPTKDLLQLGGLPGAPALLLPISVFFIGMGVSGRRIYRYYFG